MGGATPARLDSPDGLSSEPDEPSSVGSPPQSPSAAASSPFKDKPLTPREISALVSQVRRSRKYKLRPIWDAAAAGALAALTHLDLSRNDLDLLPPSIGNLTALRTLVLTDNLIRSLPLAVASLTALRSLDVSHNQLSSIPAPVVAAPSLTYLDLSSNPITELGVSTDAAAVARRLSFAPGDDDEHEGDDDGRPARSAPLTLELPVLDVLKLHSLKLMVIPPQLGTLASVTQITLQYSGLHTLPPEVAGWVSLRGINLEGNKLATLPPEVGAWKHVEFVSLANNELAVLPPDVGAWTALEVLNVASNKLAALPPALGACSSLVELNAADNLLTALEPSLCALPTLREMNLNGNQLTSLPTALGSLTALVGLHLSDNALAALPASIGALTALKVLAARNNALRSLPDAIARLVRLVQLSLDNNALEVLPDAIGSLRSLQELYLSNNALTTVPVTIGQCSFLKYLYLNNNRIKSLPPALGHCRALSRLDLYNNPLRKTLRDVWVMGVSSILEYLRNPSSYDMLRQFHRGRSYSDPPKVAFTALAGRSSLVLDAHGYVDADLDSPSSSYRPPMGLHGPLPAPAADDTAAYAFGDASSDSDSSPPPPPFKRLSFGTSAYSKAAVIGAGIHVLDHDDDDDAAAADRAAAAPATPFASPPRFGSRAAAPLLALPASRPPPPSSAVPVAPADAAAAAADFSGSYQSNLSAVDPNAQVRAASDLSGPLSEYEIDAKDIELGVKLGEGAFGAVFKGSWGGVEVAAKVLKYDTLPTRAVISGLRHEVAVLSKLHHPNVVSLIGACLQPPFLCIVTEYIGGGSLHALLHDEHQRVYLTWLLRIALDVARGMSYLHGSQPKIIHRDLSSHNILIAYPISGANFTAKIADFGLAFVKESNESICTGVTGKVRWVAPEVLLHKEYDEKADVYSYGIVLWEILTGLKPFAEVQPASSIPDVVAQGGRPPIPTDSPTFLTKLIRDCWRQEAARRPSFEDVVRRLMKADRASRRRSLGELLVDYL